MASASMLAVDVGGTFTDVIGVRDGQIETIKVPTDHANTHLSVLAGAKALGASDRAVFNHASTAGLNALLTRRLPKIGFLTTEGHRDMLDMARSWRPFEALTDAHWRKSFGDSTAPLVPRYLRRGVRERMLASGEILIPLDEGHVREELERFARCEIEGIAVCLLNSYVNPEHELRIGELVREVLGEIPCSISSFVSPLAKEYPRATTTVIDALMTIVFGAYTQRLQAGLRTVEFAGELNFADSAATLMNADYAIKRPFKLVFAGPAAGTVASAHLGALLGDSELLCCDVGGTSSDISLVIDGAPVLNTVFELEPDLLVNAPSIEIASLGAGGGSIISGTRGGEIRVGPESAGAEPGPACYGRGGTVPTMTDAFLLIGLLDPDRFNAGALALDRERALAAFEELDSPLGFEDRIRHGYRLGLNNVAQGLIDVSVRRGIDARRYTLIAYGAAGPLMLPAVLADVRARRVIVPPYPGLFSALGLLSSNRVYSDSRTAYRVLAPDAAEAIMTTFAEMEAALADQARDRDAGLFRRSFDGRLVGQSWETPFVAVPDGALDERAVEAMIGNFHDEYERRFGNRFEDYAVEAVSYRVDLVVPSSKVEYAPLEAGDARELAPDRMLELCYLDAANSTAGEYERDRLRAGNVVRGPAIIREATSTTHLLAGQLATVGSLGELVIELAPA
ncbi:MAG TPA: hydantoinase/oxoprolinase family protein [Solirubrobacteraceae bacterium]|jgi:N-methylhydantoinase A|nr:hydantoinase/oxoprolinase family protein [Solirubrobacteraceae bacterium]